MPDLTQQNPKMSPTKILPSPPVSPWVGNNKSREVEIGSPTPKVSNDNAKDPVLYPPSESGTDHTSDPLFPPELSQPSQEDQLITSHIEVHKQQFEGKKNRPTFEEYKMALSCVSKVAEEYNKNPGAWLKRERDFVEEQFRAVRRYKQQLKAPPRRQFKVLAPAPTYTSDESPTKIVKRTRVHRAPVQRTPRQPTMRTPKSTPKSTIFESFDSPYYTPPKPRNTEPRTEDTNYEAIEDFCPPLDSLGGNTKGLKAEWKGQGLPLDEDPDRHLLLPAEVQMASALRLSCAQYLTTKRRIFKAKVELLQQGVESFKKTHAQKAGHIDVNKASRLHTAYERVGWFNTEHFLKFLN